MIVAGAGAGDPELITLKAYRLLQEVPVVLYDNLVNKSLLDYTKPDCENIYVGKLPYGEYTPQEQINELIKEKAFSKGRVLRLKGGDPFIFGRGFEEILFARQHGISTSYIPGITSMQASGLYDIPLTFRNISESIWVVTGTKKDGSLSADLQLAIQSKATVVIYMGMKKLPEIAATYINKGYGHMPAAIIHYASMPYHKLARGKIKDLPQLAAAQHITHPALIIIGPVTDTALLSGNE
nr:uroporphyrinogen-III C-methyltransferase [Longitalea luteola]